MRKALLCILILFTVTVAAQTAHQHPNFYDIQKAFYASHPEAAPFYAAQHPEAQEQEAANEEKFHDGDIEQFKRWEAFMEPRVYPSGNFFDPGILMREYYQYNQSHPATLRSGDWQLIGPDIVPQGVSLAGAGRINTIAINPQDTNIIYAGAPCGGLWKSTDGGNTWSSNSSDLLPSISIGDIAIDPLHPDILYAATGDSYGNEYYGQGTGDFWGGTYSAGIMKSTDGGISWSPTGMSYDQTDADLIYRIVLNPIYPDTLFAGTRGGLFRSFDGGATWTNLKHGYFFDIELNPANPNTVYAVNDSSFFYSHDEGDTWTQGSSLQAYYHGARISIAVTAADTNKIYAWTEASDFYVSNNAGVSFSSSTSPSSVSFSQGTYDIVLTASPNNENKILAGGINLAQSTDGGSTWTEIGGGYSTGPDQIHPDFHAEVYYPNDDSRLLVGNDGGIFKSGANGTFPWKDISNGMAIKQYYRMGNSVVDEHYILAGAQDNGSDKYDGNAWTHILGADGMQPLVDYQDDKINYASSQGGNVNRSIDGSLTFGSIYPTDPSGQYYYYGHWTTPFVLDPTNHHTIYFGGAAFDLNNNVSFGTILKSTDDGLTWSIIMDGDVGASDVFYRVRIAPSDPQTIYASTIGQIFRTNDGGSTWTEITAGLPYPDPVGGISDIAISNIDPQKVWVTFSGYADSEKVYQSDDGGTTWNNFSGTLPNIPVDCIAFQRDASNMIYIGTDFGVFYRNDDVSDWQSFNNGLPNVMVDDLQVLYSFNKLRAATYGRSIWEATLPISAATANDAGLVSVVSPSGSSCESTAEIKVSLKNFGSSDLTSVNLHYSIDGGAEQMISWAGDLVYDDTTTVSFGTASFTDGVHEIVAYTSEPNGLADDNSDNDKRSGIYDVSTAIASIPIQEGFENGFPPAQWHLIGSLWLPAAVGGFTQSDNSMLAPFYDVASGQGKLVTPLFTLDGNYPPPALLTFDHSYARYAQPGYLDTLQVLITTDCFSTTTILYQKSDLDLKTAPDTYSYFVPSSSNQWKNDTINLTSYIGMNDLQVGFVARSGYGNNLYVDDINLGAVPLSLSPVDADAFTLFPNPTMGKVMIVYSPSQESDLNSLDVINDLGEVIIRISGDEMNLQRSEELDLSHLAKGIYSVKMNTSKGTLMKKVVVM